jgi:hypothetical protein
MLLFRGFSWSISVAMSKPSSSGALHLFTYGAVGEFQVQHVRNVAKTI